MLVYVLVAAFSTFFVYYKSNKIVQ